MPQPLIELGGTTHLPVMHLAPANGFVPETYLPMFAPFMDNFRVVSAPPRALWGDDDPPKLTLPEETWLDLSRDMLAAYDQFGLDNIVALGHSIGGNMTILAAVQQAERFKALILLDPVILPREACAWMKNEREQGNILPMAQGAMRRRKRFYNVDDAFQNFHGKSIFANWSDEVLQLYAEHGTVDCLDDLRCLRWSPMWEAYYYMIYYTEIWDELPKLKDLSIPILVIAGGDSDTFFPHIVDEVEAMLPNATVERIAGHGHLFPQSTPQATSEIIQTWLMEHGLLLKNR